MGFFCMYASKLHRCKSLLQTSNHLILKSRFLSSFHTFSSPCCSVVDNTIKKLQESSKVIIILTPKCINSTLQNCPSDLFALSFFLWCARQLGYFHDKFAFHHHMVSVVTRLTQWFPSVKEIIRQLETVGFVKKPQAFLILLRIYWYGGADFYSFVFEAFDEMIEYGYTPNTFARNIVMDVLFKIGNASEALRFFSETRVPNFLTFSIAVCNLCKLDNIDNVRRLLRVMLRKGYYLTTELVSVVLNCYCKLGRLNEAFQLLGFMVTSGIPVSVYVRSILIDGFYRSGRLVTASSLLENMIRTGFLLDVVTCTSLIRGFLKSGNLFMASSLLRKLKQGCSPDLVLYNVLIDCLSKMGRYDDALSLFSNLPNRKLTPDPYTYCSITSTITLSRKFSLLPSVVGGRTVQADLAVFNSLVNYFCKAGCPSHAVELYDFLLDLDFVPDRYTYAGLLIGLCGVENNTDVAVNVYHGILRSQFVVDAHIHTIIVNGLIKSGSISKGIKLLEAAIVEKYPLDVVAYTVAIRALLRFGSFAAACRLYEQMKRHGVVPNANVCKVLLYSLCKMRDFLMVKEIRKDMVDNKIVIDENTFSMTQRYSFRSEHLPSILRILNELSDSGLIQKRPYFVP